MTTHVFQIGAGLTKLVDGDNPSTVYGTSNPIPTIDEKLPNQSQFGEEPMVQRTQLIELKSTYGLSDLRDVQDITGTGAAITNTIGVTAECCRQVRTLEDN